MLKKSVLACALLSLLSGTAHASDSILPVAKIKYYGVCDGSAAIRIDEQTLLVANDENNLLISYDLWGGKPVAHFNLSTILNGLNYKGDKVRELDIEAATKVGEKIWWVASHGPNKSGKSRPNRRSFFSTNTPDRNLQNMKIIDKRIDITPILMASPKTSALITNKVINTPPKQGGLNIEAMAFTPEGKLLIGLRSPLTGNKGMNGKATLITLENVDKGWQVADTNELNVKDKGFRDLIAFGSGYLMIAGNVESGGKFTLHSLSEKYKPSKVTKLKPKTLNPEALVDLNKQLLVLSDDGNAVRNDEGSDNTEKKNNCKSWMGDNLDKPSDDLRVFFRGTVFDLGLPPTASNKQSH